MQSTTKPFGRKSYGSIGHLPGSQFNAGDKGMNEGHTRIATIKARDKHDMIYVQEKLDGACVAVGKKKDTLVAMSRSGYPANSSKYYHIRLFENYMRANYERFYEILGEGERAVGEWLALAHGTRYNLFDREPFVLFDIMKDSERLNRQDLYNRNIGELGFADAFITPVILAEGPTSIEDALEKLGTYGWYGAGDPVEGAVWRVERKGKVDFLCKFVRPDFERGKYLPEVSGEDPIWNWP